MPDAIRVTVEGFRARPQRGGFRAGAAVLFGLVAWQPAHAQTPDTAPDSTALDAYLAALFALDRHEIAALALTLGILCFAVLTAIALVRTRRRLAEVETRAHDESIDAKAAVARAKALLLTEPQVLVEWAPASDEPEIIGDPTLVASPEAPHRVLAFGTWLEPEPAQALERSVDALRARGVSFASTVTTLAGRVVEADGQIVGGRAILRLRDVSGTKYELAELKLRHQKLIDDTAALRVLVDELPAPVWARDDAGKLLFVNSAYARAVDAKDAAEAVERGIELFGGNARTEIFRAHEAQKNYAARLPAVVAGHRHSFDVHTVPAARGSAGIGIDVTENELVRAELARMIDAHRRTLDQLKTGVAIFGSNQKLSFYNAAYRSLWDLDPAFLDEAPTDSAAARQAARRPQPSGDGGLPQMEGRAARGLPGDRAQAI